MTEKEALLVLNATPGLGNILIPRLVAHFGGAAKVLDRKPKELIQSGIAAALAQKIFDFPRDTFLENEYNLLARYGVSVLTQADAGYPAGLKEIPDAPVVLYYKGDVASTCRYPGIAVVGSRRASVYGRGVALKISNRLAALGIPIVSGLARGIDAAAHEGCLQVRGLTVAVLGCGLAQVYPPEHDALAQRIAASGVVFSEFPMTMPPLAPHFPRRNRIISGLALGVVVVEAASRSGALITAGFALDMPSMSWLTLPLVYARQDW